MNLVQRMQNFTNLPMFREKMKTKSNWDQDEYCRWQTHKKEQYE